MWYDFILNNFYLISGFAVLINFILIIFFLSRPGREVICFSENDRRIYMVKIDEETPKRLVNNSKDPYRFFKYRGSWSGIAFGGLKNMTSWIGKMGTAYTFRAEGGKDIKIGDLYEGLLYVWGEDVCNKLKEEQRDKLKQSNIWVTVDLEQGITPEGFEPITEKDLVSEAEAKLTESYARGREEGQKRSPFDLIITLIAGAGIGIIASLLIGWIQLMPK